MRYRLKDVFAQFDEVCRSIFKAAADEAKSHDLAPQRTFQPDLPSELEDRPGDNSYATHVARGMAKMRSRG
jgi:hypothetical protein